MRKSFCVIVPEHRFGVKAHVLRIPIEAKSLAKPVIISEEAFGKRGLNKDSFKGGIIADVSDTKKFVESIKKLLDDENLYKKVSLEGKRSFDKSNNWEKYVDEFESALYDVISKK